MGITCITICQCNFVKDSIEPISERGQIRKSRPSAVPIKNKPDLNLGKVEEKKGVNGSLGLDAVDGPKDNKKEEKGVKIVKVNEKEAKQVEEKGSETEDLESENGKENEVEGESEEGKEEEEEENTMNGALDGTEGDVDQADESIEIKAKRGKKQKFTGPLFDPKAEYGWKLCSTRSKHNYIPCIDFEATSKRMKSYRHHERSCPKNPLMCLVPLPHEGYRTPVSWPESREKIWYKNVAHPKLAQYAKTQNWVVESGEYLTFPQNQSELTGGIAHYLESIEETVPDIEWGKNIRTILDIGCIDSSFGAFLSDKNAFTLTLGLKDDLVDLAQVALERGFPAIVSPFGTRRLPFPSGTFDTIHCGECQIHWQSNGGKLLIEMNRILRPAGYLIMSSKHDSIEDDEAMSKLTASVGWNVLAHKTDDVSDIGIRIYQKPESNEIYSLRRKKVPPMCKDNENADAAWYVPINSCLHLIPSAIEERGTEWPEEWPKRLQTFPDWMNNRDKLVSDTTHWKSIFEKSYLTGMGINWSTIRNVMDMHAIFGSFAAALLQQKVWVMNVVPVYAPDTLPIIFERGLIGIYHDWCEPFGTYPRSYDLLHADHLFSRLKNRCKQPVTIVVEMDRILRPGGWAIIRDKGEILKPLEAIFRSLNWEIRMTFVQNKEGILCIQKTIWRP
ncbi:probable methyltransferase PMT28 isoform X2 [Cynara cardunculus var. scolymus]|uniref:probable methyltransferase PMT28 isoform X2 n=1 Tax=Cynara cardunculus var. scolymus TaxID=59895 RepID=UPI000D625127|nr:probable methyltransferase PMT28 isoform X2 [Cynara cardunculus var. scolymus]